VGHRLPIRIMIKAIPGMHRLATLYAIKPSGNYFMGSDLLRPINYIAVRASEVDGDTSWFVHPNYSFLLPE
jgi:hypothetical protein